MSIITEHIQPLLDKRIPAALFALLCASGANAQDCSLKQVASVPITLESDGTISIPVKIHGLEKRMSLAMDADTSGVTETVAAATASETILLSPLPVHIISGSVIKNRAILSDIEVGGVRVTDFSALDIPDALNPQSDGRLGLDFLRSFDVDLDFANGKLNLFSQDHCEGKVVYWANYFGVTPFALDHAGFPVFEMTLDGKVVRGALGTLDPISAMSLALAEKKVGVAPDSPDLKLVPGVSGHSPATYRYPFKSLSLGDISITNPNIELLDVPYSDDCDGQVHRKVYGAYICSGLFDVKIVVPELKKLHLYIAFKEKRLYVTAADAHK